MKVSCEGYNNYKDPYILHGSCGVRALNWSSQPSLTSFFLFNIKLEYKLESIQNQDKISFSTLIAFLVIVTTVKPG